MTTTIKMFIFYELNIMKMLELTVLFSTKRNISQLTLIASARVITDAFKNFFIIIIIIITK